jgi:rod shape-determining protein MreC
VDISRHDRRRRLTLILLVITSLALVSLDERGSGLINSARTAAQDVVSPLQDGADAVIDPVTDWLDGLGRANELQDENQKLKEQLANARSEIAAAKGSLARLATLESIYDLSNVQDGDAVVAEVIDGNAGNFSRAFRISKGSSSGIGLDMAVVVGAAGKAALVGKVVRVSSGSAVVQRIDDPEFGAGAQLVQGDKFGPTGLATGQRDSNLLRFSVVGDTLAVKLEKGDVAVTLGAPGEPFPKGLVIGTIVREVGTGGAIARDASLRPVVDLDAITVVKVLKPPAATP